MTYYHQIYRCRKCGNEFCPVTVHTETVMYIELNNFLNRVNGELEWDHKEMPLAPRLYRAHLLSRRQRQMCIRDRYV